MTWRGWIETVVFFYRNFCLHTSTFSRIKIIIFYTLPVRAVFFYNLDWCDQFADSWCWFTKLVTQGEGLTSYYLSLPFYFRFTRRMLDRTRLCLPFQTLSSKLSDTFIWVKDASCLLHIIKDSNLWLIAFLGWLARLELVWNYVYIYKILPCVDKLESLQVSPSRSFVMRLCSGRNESC